MHARLFVLSSLYRQPILQLHRPTALTSSHHNSAARQRRSVLQTTFLWEFECFMASSTISEQVCLQHFVQKFQSPNSKIFHYKFITFVCFRKNRPFVQKSTISCSHSSTKVVVRTTNTRVANSTIVTLFKNEAFPVSVDPKVLRDSLINTILGKSSIDEPCDFKFGRHSLAKYHHNCICFVVYSHS